MEPLFRIMQWVCVHYYMIIQHYYLIITKGLIITH